MVNSATATKTPPSHGLNSGSGLKSTPLAVGSAVVSEHRVSTLGVKVDDVRPWIAWDVDNYKESDADGMLQQLLCSFEKRTSSEKSKLLQDSLEAVLDVCKCNSTPKITDNLTAFATANCTVVTRATVLRAPSTWIFSGIPASPRDNETDILFRHNAKNIMQRHQDLTSTRKPDVVLVSSKAAKGLAKDGEGNGNAKGKGKGSNGTDEQKTKAKFYVKQADRNFKWIDFRSTVEFKRKGGTLAPPALHYQVTDYAPPKPGFKYLNLPKATKKPAEPTASAPARSSSKPSNESRPIRVCSRLTKKADNTRKSDDILSNESFKHGKTADENCTGEDRTDEKEPKRLHPKIENGLYVAEIFAASIALQHVVSYVVNSKLPEYCRPAICQNDPDELVAKLYWPEEQRQGILAKVHDTAGKALKVAGHVPNMAWFQKFEGTSMAKIRRALGIQDPDTEGSSRVLYINVFRKLIPITSLSGDEFLHAWWQVVECHYILWKHDVHHRDVSPSNLMVHWLNGKWIGVLNDHDLSSIQHDGLSGSERTGTVPSMALELLARDAIEGKIKHLYRHDAESFIWVLTWVCLRYENGKLLSEGRPLDDWLRVDAIGCHDKKAGFMQNVKYQHLDIESSPSNEDNCDIAVDCTLTFLEAPANPNPAHSKRPNSKQ